MYNKMFCYNCHEHCHIASTCTKFVDSFGVICYHIDNSNKIKFLAIKRKFSLAFCEFIRGRYNLLDTEYLSILFSKMTLLEHYLIQNTEFKKLWSKLWICNNRSSFNKYYLKAAVKFNILKQGFVSIDDNNIYRLSDLIFKCKQIYRCSEWYFPKGKKEINEDSIDSAIREFEEETNIQRCNIKIAPDPIFKESHKSYNNKKYRTFFHIAELKTDITEIDITIRNKFQKNEIGNIEWLTLNECLDKFRSYERSKKDLILNVYKHIKTSEKKL